MNNKVIKKRKEKKKLFIVDISNIHRRENSMQLGIMAPVP
jgi:hypothetical protein